MANTNGKEHVSIELKKDGSVVAREDIDNLRPTTANTTTKVSCNVGVTKSIGNYEFVKIDCGFEEYCGSEEKHEVFDSLATQAMDRLTHFIENMDNVKRNLAVRSVLSRSCDDPHVQACARTKWILNEEMKIFFKGDYQTFADALKDYGKITEGQAREAVIICVKAGWTFLIN